MKKLFVVFAVSLIYVSIQAKSLNRQIKEAKKEALLKQIKEGGSQAPPCNQTAQVPCNQTAQAPCSQTAQMPVQQTKVVQSFQAIVQSIQSLPSYYYSSQAFNVYTCFGSTNGVPDKNAYGGVETRAYWIITMVRVDAGIQNGIIVPTHVYLNETFSVAVPARMAVELHTQGRVFNIIPTGRVIASTSLKDVYDPYRGTSSSFLNENGELTATFRLQ